MAKNKPKIEAKGNTKLSILLAMAMFVLVVDTSIMNVSLSAVVKDLGTTVSDLQAAIALEALVSAAFILISSKLGDIFGRKRAYVLGLLGYAIGAIAMTLTHSIAAVFIFWAIIGGLGASLLLPAMQSLIHGNFTGAAQRKTYALVGAAAAIAAAVGPLLGGFLTTYITWRAGFFLEAVVIAIILLNIGLVKDVVYEGPRKIDFVGALLSVVGMGGVVLGILLWQEGAESVGLVIAIGLVGLSLLAYWLIKRKREGKTYLLDPGLFKLPHFRLGISQVMMQNIILGGSMIALPIFLQMTLEYNAMKTGLTLAPLSLTMFAVAILTGKRAGNRRPSSIIRAGFILSTLGLACILPIIPRTDSGWILAIPLMIVGAGLGLLVSQLNNYTLAPIDEKHVSEAAGVNSASGSFGLSFGLAMAGGIMLAVLAFSFTNLTNESTVIPPAEQQQISTTLEDDAEIMSNSQLEQQLEGQPQNIQDEVLSINTEARSRSLQIALLVPIFAGLVGIFNSFRMMRLPDIKPSAAAEAAALG
ncbi:MFS transporter [Candidatus Saccharibacteria bacterium]|nr:MFS transporter [Candidatus Saccharibacteria bacterium]